MQTLPAESCTAALAKTKLLGPGKWKRLATAALYTPIFLLLSSNTCSAADRPVIFNYSKIAEAGDVINLQGHAFGPKPEAWCSINGAEAVKLQVINSGNNVVHVRLPAKSGHLRLQVKNANLASDQIAISQASPTYVDSCDASQDSSWVIGSKGRKDYYNVCSDNRLRLHAKGDGANNDQEAIQQAIDTAAAQGGGIIYLPHGTYKLEKASGPLLELKSKVVLAGAGFRNTIINFGYGRAAKDSCLLKLDNTFKCGVCDLAIENISTNGNWFNAKTITSAQACNNFFLSEVKANLKNAFRIDLKGDHISVRDCQLSSLYTLLFMSTCTNSQVRGNILTQKLGVNLDITRSKNCVVENNKFILDANNGAIEKGNVRHGLAIDLAHNLSIINNQFSTINGEATLNNDGEALLSEGGGGDRKAEELGTIVSGKKSQCKLSKSNDFVDGAAIAIVSGRGLGQWRYIKSRKDDLVELDRPWLVTPNKTSNYSIFIWSNQNTIIKGNSFIGWPRGIWIYQASTTDTQISHNKFEQMDGIFIEPCQNSVRDKGQFNMVWNTVIDHNTLSSGKAATYINITADLQQTTQLAGTTALNNQIYKNTIIRNGSKNFANDPANFEGYCNYLRVEAAPYDDKPNVVAIPALLGTIFQDNIIQDPETKAKAAYLINGGAYQTTIIAPGIGASNLVDDSKMYWNTHGSHGSTSTVVEQK